MDGWEDTPLEQNCPYKNRPLVGEKWEKKPLEASEKGLQGAGGASSSTRKFLSRPV